jgi:hypothetical protein
MADDPNSFPIVDYSDLVCSDCYKIDSSTDAITVFNLFYREFGYGDFDISGNATHTESAVLIGSHYSETIQCDIKRVKIYHTVDYTSSFFVDFINEKNEILTYCYRWQYNNANAWENGKYSTWFCSDDWYKTANNKTKTSWNIVINK